jgi:hypothetical protein
LGYIALRSFLFLQEQIKYIIIIKLIPDAQWGGVNSKHKYQSVANGWHLHFTRRASLKQDAHVPQCQNTVTRLRESAPATGSRQNSVPQWGAEIFSCRAVAACCSRGRDVGDQDGLRTDDDAW